MRKFWICFILILAITWARAETVHEVGAWQEPLVRLAVMSYFMSSGAGTEQEKTLEVIQQIEKALLTENKTHVVSLEDYLRRRHQVPATPAEYWQKTQREGLLNPLNITTPNTDVFEKIVEYEVYETQAWIRTWSQHLSTTRGVNFDAELGVSLQATRAMLAVYELGLGFRDRMDQATRSWDKIPVLGFLRSVGKNVVNPLVRAAIYSEPVLNQMKVEMRRQFATSRQQVMMKFDLFKERAQELGVSFLERQIALGYGDLEFMKPLKTLDTTAVFEISLDFFRSLPDAVKQDIVWFWLKQPHAREAIQTSPSRVAFEFFKDRHPGAKDVLEHFMAWLQRSDTKERLQKLSPLPVWEATYSLAHIVYEAVLDTRVVSTRLLAEFTQRNLWGVRQGHFQIFVSAATPQALSETSFAEFVAQNPAHGEFLKRKLAQAVLHNVFYSGARPLLGREVRVIPIENPVNEQFRVEIQPLGPQDGYAVDSTEKIMAAMAQLPLGELASLGQERPDFAHVFSNTSLDTQHRLRRFMAEPQSFRWALQLYQLGQLVGNDIVQSELKSFLIKNPRLWVMFLKEKMKKKSEPLYFDSQVSRCQFFYKQ